MLLLQALRSELHSADSSLGYSQGGTQRQSSVAVLQLVQNDDTGSGHTLSPLVEASPAAIAAATAATAAAAGPGMRSSFVNSDAGLASTTAMTTAKSSAGLMAAGPSSLTTAAAAAAAAAADASSVPPGEATATTTTTTGRPNLYRRLRRRLVRVTGYAR